MRRGGANRLPHRLPRGAAVAPAAVVAAIVAAIVAAACAAEVLPDGPPLTLTATPASLELTAGDSARVSVAAAGTVPRPLRLVWRSSAPSVVAVDSTGRVRALDAGAAVVTVEVGGGAGPSLGVAVTSAAPCTLGVPMGRPELAALALRIGRPARPNVVAGACRPGGDPTLVYESSDTTIVAIDSATGLPVGRAQGQATVTVRLRAAPSVRVAVPASVWRCGGFEPMLVVQPSALTLAPGESGRLAFTVAFPPGMPTSERPAPTLVSSDTTVATVSADGTVRALRVGGAIVTVSYALANECGPYSQSVAVTVRAP